MSPSLRTGESVAQRAEDSDSDPTRVPFLGIRSFPPKSPCGDEAMLKPARHCAVKPVACLGLGRRKRRGQKPFIR